jgi:hypothetical protein
MTAGIVGIRIQELQELQETEGGVHAESQSGCSEFFMRADRSRIRSTR